MHQALGHEKELETSQLSPLSSGNILERDWSSSNILPKVQVDTRKKRYDQIQPAEYHLHGEVLVENETEASTAMSYHGQKRSQRTDWSIDRTAMKSQVCPDSTRPSQSMLQDLRSQSFTRESKFIEGSMGSRLNGPPPSLYTREESTKANNPTDGGDGHIIGSLEQMYISYDAGIEPPKLSGMSRFSRALSDAFTPVWHGFGRRKDKEPEQPKSRQDDLQSRQIKAEKAYTELKKTGFKGTQWALRSDKSRLSLDISVARKEESRSTQPMAPMDSAIMLDRSRYSMDNRSSILSSTDRASMVPSTNAGSPSVSIKKRESSFLLRKPSFPILKKVKSQLDISSNKNESTSTLGPVSIVETGAGKCLTSRPVLRPQPSKKDLQKQHRLSKKVSDLETKLEIARRNLMLATDQGPQVPEKLQRKVFVPGSLASLPSERLLNRDTLANEQSEGDSKARTLSTASQGFQIWTEEAGGGSAEKPIKIEPKDDNVTPTKLETLDKREAFGEITPNACQPCQTMDTTLLGGTERKLGEQETENEVHEATMRYQLKMSKPKYHTPSRVDIFGSPGFKTLDVDAKNQGSKIDNNLSFNPSVFNPADVDTTKLMSMRANSDSTKAFGQLTEDINLLRKEYPDITNDQVMKYISGILTEDRKSGFRLGRNTHKAVVLAASKQNTDYTSLSHQDQLPAPILGRPRSVSPRKCRRSVSPPQPGDRLKIVVANAPFPPAHRSSVKDRADDFITVSPTKDKSVPPVPKVPKDLEGQTAKVKPNMTIKEDDEFQWDDDVF